MTKSIRKRPPGRPPTGMGVQIGTRWHAPAIKAIDEWRRQQQDAPSRTEAIRRLVELALAETQPTRQRSAKATLKALDLAGEQIDKLISPSATDEERQQRKRRLLKGPKEFRDIRGDVGAAKENR